ncbi:putative phospholipid ABC transporter permease protein MlaE [Hartmannibacter diazotrophicus]|uniref:Putative phospholipid ABC transporter permease protein MlaE n=1 Tax=Hartmannibacter diazotrophicus TaxID=1482074 RepID=A0A2C9D9J5_9HYPH|nr:ABC transporter permease [Hartmannibacter diazotrophicus]SON56255.1 putative phospholipid ABC transporter permease protein MlaE [Hartmannibacter diazotrophicus]
MSVEASDSVGEHAAGEIAAVETPGRLVFSGEWTISTARKLEEPLDEALPKDSGETAVLVIDGSGIKRMDTAGAWLIENARRTCNMRSIDVQLVGFDPEDTILLQTVSKLLLDVPKEPEEKPLLRRWLEAVGHEVVDLGYDVIAVLSLFGEMVAGIGQIITRKQPMRWAAFFTQMDRVGLKAIPIIALMSFLIGMIIAQQGGFYLRTFGAEVYVIALVGVLVCREIGVLLTAIMIAGRSGSAMTAEIGSMKMREEIDALTVLGVSPTCVLVVPRVMALVLTLPLLTVVSDLSAMAGAWIVVVFYIGLPTDTFLQLLREAVTVTYFLIGVVKAPVMAATIGLVACTEGMKVSGSAESLGLHTTISVVKGIFAVILMDGIFAIVLASLGI